MGWIMKTLIKNGKVINVFTGEIEKTNVLVANDKIAEDFLKYGHIDHMIRIAGENGKSTICAIQMATIQAADCLGIKDKGAIASTVAHDAHNLVVVGTNDEDMAIAGNYLQKNGGGYVAVCDGEVIGSVPLEIGGR